jgi:hypothetical protein
MRSVNLLSSVFLDDNEVFGFIKPKVDIHTLGISIISALLNECGYKTIVCGSDVAEAADDISKFDNLSFIKQWIRTNGITRLGFSYRLDPQNACYTFGKLFHLLHENQILIEQGGPVRKVYFAGLPEACRLIKNEYESWIPVFAGDESPIETLKKVGVPELKIPKIIADRSQYDINRFDFAKDLIQKSNYCFQQPLPRLNYLNYGTRNDSLSERIWYNRKRGMSPLMRVHVGPYQPNYEEAKKEFNTWLTALAETGFLDIVSVGSSQLSQSDFGEDWGNRQNGGGVPINSVQDLIKIWEMSRPMLIRTYSSTRHVPQMAKVYERTLNMAWHALSLWWFNKIDGRGPNTVIENLHQHIEALDVIARAGKPFEPNIPHHFSFRGGDDYTYVLSSYLAAIAAKKMGIKKLVLQTMLNTPKYTWGIQDLAKARALLRLVKELENEKFVVYHQPRAGLDYFSPDLTKAKIQLAAVTAMMDDIEPYNPFGPDIIHVVSYCEAIKLATPAYINESIQITLHALAEYRIFKKKNGIENLLNIKDVNERTDDIYWEVKRTVDLIKKKIPNLFNADGLYKVFQKGIFVVPYLWEGRDEFKNAVNYKTGIFDGGVFVLDENGSPVKLYNRVHDLLYKDF